MSNPLVSLRADTEYKVFTELADNPREFESLQDLKAALIEVLEKYPKELPAVFDPFDMLVWGRRNGWVTSPDGTRFLVQAPE